MNLYQCEAAAQTGDAASGGKFTIVSPKGILFCEWLDAHLGLIRLKGVAGFVMTRDLDASVPNAECFPLWESDE